MENDSAVNARGQVSISVAGRIAGRGGHQQDRWDAFSQAQRQVIYCCYLVVPRQGKSPPVRGSAGTRSSQSFSY